ncbi:MAG: signal recognition particle-docking protein FtsY [Candidatus Schekmanbacteria bacterium RIFCSPHIGHO2_02_FULL_38_11]|uniref:Signal recognition particle receptor FtsY n=1 Tax=Candidatus Schekmanbacteria bacterium RIFCSPLOWO2_12_FULL_38_15 TaxID=1817883 RepID=A0A1F7SG95_9BACT|nr:MAG: signal recognition particle-docking protein FtsY [Candidatus Schekmanbacteria bacterium GWA2_38_9]OGL49332.1 MAG: signal recognition particle-docking protein FtsY [Candidatus Schekmanbacteria bacterium RIFCSPLOWO2_02_FULL_38_14]OGL52810.1 MAG: signal recognition particle-docking protein FtsY [Candidatus Schekmanbacteria bacterium RIFCSPLOWO2_12_FULL_38_15]OGL55249.1 MAG: signal recognition particle-docking protein FtsY [Candidatus Schekmanbacteria bacterium RIFCSPHIGHO2_02_FULL_38_11]
MKNLLKKSNNFFSRLKNGLSKTRQGLISRVENLLSLGQGIDEEFFTELEEILILSDLGVQASNRFIEDLKNYVKNEKVKEANLLKDYLKKKFIETLESGQCSSSEKSNFEKPSVIMVVGVNGVGKTTTIGKFASLFTQEGKKVMLAAADTFRAAADEQLEIWGRRADVPVVRGNDGSDPSSVAFDSIKSAMAREIDILIIDTAGRLHVKKNLMEELKKMKRVVGKAMEGAPHEILLVLDATTGQNSIAQAKMFNDALELTGIVLTKLDGTAKGGIIVAIAEELKIPVKFIGVGEGIEDFQEFNPKDFVEALFSS